jgi:protein gp37
VADKSKIEWTDATWNPITGCSVLSPGCKHCYAMLLAGTRLSAHSSRAGLTIDTKAGPVWTGEVRFNDQWLDQPLRWRQPRAIFVCAHADLFHESVPDSWIDQIFAMMAAAPQHLFQVLTKRPSRMAKYLKNAETTARIHAVLMAWGGASANDAGRRAQAAWRLEDWPLSNVWAGVSVEDGARLNRVASLRETPAAVRWISAEPLLGSLKGIDLTGVAWVVSGGESGPRARPTKALWHRELRDACEEAGVAYHFKQWGEFLPEGQFDKDGFMWAPGRDGRVHWWLPEPPEGEFLQSDHCAVRVGKRQAGRDLDGRLHDGMPS